MRNANKSPKVLYSAKVRKMKKLSGIHTQIRITTESYQFFSLVGPINHNTKFR